MAWGGRAGRLSGSFVKGMFKRWRSPPRYNDDFGVPRAVQKQLAQENLASDPDIWNARLKELLSAYKQKG
jgi:hypothetical protein